jgi:hypothetical protein
VSNKLLGRLQTTIDQLVDFEDSQSAFFLLRVSFSIVRAVHFMRTTPLRQWRAQAFQFDAMLRDAATKILGFPMDSFTFAQAALTPKLGGLGLRKTVEHADLAFAASWHESQRTAHEVWVVPDGLGDYVTQKKASFEFDERVYRFLLDNAPTEREAQRLRRIAQPHAGCFVTAVPSEEDGNDTILRPRNFRIAVAYRLGLPVLNNNIPCPMCMQTIDKLGDHATCCSKSGDLIVRHNSVRNLVDRIATDGLLSPIMEKKGILGPTSGRRPGDVTIPIWTGGKSLAIDVAVTSPFTLGHLRLSSPCEDYADRQKHQKYDDSFRSQPYLFAALVLETTGAINQEGEEVLRQIFRFAAKRLGREFSSFCGRAWARLSCNLQRSVSQAILSRIDGQAGAHYDLCPRPTQLPAKTSVPEIPPFPSQLEVKPVPSTACPPRQEQKKAEEQEMKKQARQKKSDEAQKSGVERKNAHVKVDQQIGEVKQSVAPKRPVAEKPPPSVLRVGCEMPLCDRRESCEECQDVAAFKNCVLPNHMRLCNADAWIACEHCLRILCSSHCEACYCFTRLPKAKERKKEGKRKKRDG